MQKCPKTLQECPKHVAKMPSFHDAYSYSYYFYFFYYYYFYYYYYYYYYFESNVSDNNFLSLFLCFYQTLSTFFLQTDYF